ncbi:MAG: processive 1,2-diacylglycerol beta-glucosyltransferase [Pseudonocardiales bacterium]|nr:processive 1,2-diacylglycerol beta-glucosyltransferase [Pseudonocardiales bacterium]
MSGRATNTATRVLVISGSVGAGHDGAADELVSRLAKLGVAADRRDYLDALPRVCHYILRDGYRLSIGYWPAFFDWLFANLERTGWVRRVALWLCKVAQRDVLRWVGDHDVVVSTYMLSSQTLGQLKEAGLVHATLVTFLTDPAVHRTWVHPAVDHHVTVTEATAEQGRLEYHTPMQAVGGLVSPRFAEPVDAARREQLRAELGLSPDGLVILLATGSLGMGDVPNVVRSLSSSGIGEVVVLCGRNERLRKQLSAEPGVHALGWRDDVPELMAAADVLIHNAGGLSLTEALTAGLPAVTYRPIPGHGTANSQILADAGLAPWPRDEAELVDAIRKQAVHRGDPSHVVRHPDTAALVLNLLAERDQAAVPGQDSLPA